MSFQPLLPSVSATTQLMSGSARIDAVPPHNFLWDADIFGGNLSQIHQAIWPL